ncbi:MAG: M4 family metallopeptidase, partial [Bacteroidota bacterium]
VATDVHWGTEMTYDYFYQRYGRDGYDGQGTQIPSYVHFGPKNAQNAFWNVYYAAYSDVSGNPYVGVDVVGHEFTHGVIRNVIGNLIYIDESASLNEGYADIFGNCAQHYADSSNFGWEVGEDATAFRSMSNPNSIFGLGGAHPDTYRGNGWYDGDLDNGGAHHNSTAFSHSFYLLAEGGSGTNDNGDSYQVNGIGIDKAGAIYYRMLSTYLLPTAQFADAWRAAILSAEDLFGVCSPEAVATNNAWYAIGFGRPIVDNDFLIQQVLSPGECGLTEDELITIEIKFRGCNTVPAGTQLQLLLFVQEPFSSVSQFYTLPDSLIGGETFTYTFDQGVDLSGIQDNKVFARVYYVNDTETENNISPTLDIVQRYALSRQRIDFESPNTGWQDSLILSSQNRSNIVVDSLYGRNDGYGLMMEGSGSVNFRLVNSFPLWGGPTVDAFAYNPDYSSQACACVDASDMQNLSLSFDRRQIFSRHLASEFIDQYPNPSDSLISSQVNNLRLLINGAEIERYNALTPDSDAWTTHIYNLDSLAGTQFRMCFEGKTVYSKAFDPQGRGDRIFLDNIELTGFFTSVDPRQELDFRLFPNPLRGTLHCEVSLAKSESLQLRLYAIDGKLVWQKQFKLAAGSNQIPLDLPDLTAGVYTLQAQSKTANYHEKLIIE